MASYFGEVIYPSSRAFWNDDEDDEDIDNSQENIDFIINWIEPEPSTIEKLIIIEGEIINDFVRTCLLEKAKCICTIGCESEKRYIEIYSIENVYLCTISLKLNVTQCGELTKKIEPILLKSKSIITLTSDYVSHFKSDEENNSSFLKVLYSNRAKDKNLKISYLNQPNIIIGMGAAVLTYAEFADLHCIMYILYTDTLILDSKNALPLTELFSKLLNKKLPNFMTDGVNYFNKGNLYM